MDEAEISLNDILIAFKKRWVLVILPTVVITALTWIYSYNLPKVYESTALVSIGYIGSDPVESVSATAAVMKSEQLRYQIADKVGRSNDDDYVDSLDDLVEYTDAAGMLQVSAQGKEPQAAQQLSKVITDIVLERHKKAFETEKDSLDQLVLYVKENIRPVPLSSGIREFRLSQSKLAVPANFPKKPVPSKKHYTSVALALSLLCMSMVVLFLERKSIVKPVNC